MNEQLIDIAMKVNNQTGNEFDLNHKPLDAFLAKFAELIIKECCDLVREIDAMEIRKHFGVE